MQVLALPEERPDPAPGKIPVPVLYIHDLTEAFRCHNITRCDTLQDPT